jgi:hypothetical protein
MNVDVRNGLAGSDPIVDANVEAIWLMFGDQVVTNASDQIPQCQLNVTRQLE